jgi:predicted DNA-binding transcriptional regulator AlpA
MFKAPENSTNSGAGTRTRMLTTGDAAAYLGLSVSCLNKMRISGGGPVFLKLSRAVRYRQEDLDAWTASRRYSATSAIPGNPA